jgi:hypothetical protein
MGRAVVSCEGCKERREAFMAAAKKMTAWLRNPVGPPPINLSQRPQLPDPLKGKKEKGS